MRRFPGRLGAIAHRLAEGHETALDRPLLLLADHPLKPALEDLAVGEDTVAVLQRLDLDIAGRADEAAEQRQGPDDLLVRGPVLHGGTDLARRLAGNRH